MNSDNGHIDVTEITGPMKAAISRLDKEIAETQQIIDAIERKGQEDAARAQAQVLHAAVEQAAPYRQVIADKNAVAERFRVLIAREEQEAAQATTETRHDLPTAEQDGGQQP